MKTFLIQTIDDADEADAFERKVASIARAELTSLKRLKKKLSVKRFYVHESYRSLVAKDPAYASTLNVQRSAKTINAFQVEVHQDFYNFYPLLNLGMRAVSLNCPMRSPKKRDDFRLAHAPMHVGRLLGHMRLSVDAQEWGFEQGVKQAYHFDSSPAKSVVYLYTRRARTAFMLGVADIVKEMPPELAGGILSKVS